MTGTDEGGDLHRLLRAFACVAAEPRLGAVLLFDAPQTAVGPVADLFARISADPGRDDPGEDGPESVQLGAATRDDDIWSRIQLQAADGAISVQSRPGPLVESDPATPARTVVVPDLARLGLPGLRAAVQLVGADVVSVERHGVSERWRPRARWLAFCRGDEVGQLSPHLLDRFAVRLNVAGLRLPPATETARLVSAVRAEVRGVRALPPLTDEALDEVLVVADGLAAPYAAPAEPGPGSAGQRRGIALARLARALAALGGAAATAPTHVEEAARLIGLRAAEPGPAPEPTAPWTGDAAHGADDAPAPVTRAVTDGPRDRSVAEDGLGTARLPAPDPAEVLDAFAAQSPEGSRSPYPEDQAEPLREFASLRRAGRQGARSQAERGPVIGVRRATDLRDLALVPTLVEAAKNRRLPGRRPSADRRHPHALVVTAADLRSHARAAEPERMLFLLIDHTCPRGADRQDALAPYLQWAYAARAAAAVIEVGRRDAPSELRAETFQARNVLDPRIIAALQRRPGRSTPLAHGLLLAGQLVRRAFQQQTALTEAWLVVLTDGRGNVPLRASLTGRFTGPVGRRGVDDALAAAAQMGAMGRTRLHTVVIDPGIGAGARPYGDLPFALADALGGIVAAGPAVEDAVHG
ncbi:magnesium chelatase [Streptomyces sp. NPDC051976]|uniref:magnesium chelatase n=1 Tax=Streptomyces sp. NPDC051976 TaxID=3154947 RepID=UPI003449B2CF